MLRATYVATLDFLKTSLSHTRPELVVVTFKLGSWLAALQARRFCPTVVCIPFLYLFFPSEVGFDFWSDVAITFDVPSPNRLLPLPTRVWVHLIMDHSILFGALSPTSMDVFVTLSADVFDESLSAAR